MNNMSKHFDLSEFDSPDGVLYPRGWIAPRLIPLVKDLETIRESMGAYPYKTTSGYRSYEHNKDVGGNPDSLHLRGLAHDGYIVGKTKEELYDRICYLIEHNIIRDGGVGLYDGHVHYDHGPAGRRWDERGK